jgi:hypothetical protein
MHTNGIDRIKHNVRKLKSFELKLRFDGKPGPGATLVWDSLFSLNGNPARKAKYTLTTLSGLDRNAYKSIVDEFFARVYYEYYKENGIAFYNAYDPDTLSRLDLPAHADEGDVKRRFRELAKKHHPDTGGDAAEFIELMKTYEKLIGK